MRLFVHLFDAEGCEALGCGARRTDLYLMAGGLVRACNPLCARAADARLSEEEAREIEADGWTDEPMEGPSGLIL